MNYYACGFLLSRDGKRVALLRKKHGPESLIGRLNGIGGKIEEDKQETALAAMTREFKEEAGVEIKTWKLFCQYEIPELAKVFFFKVRLDVEIKTMTDEEVFWVEVSEISKLWLEDKLAPQVEWLVPMALDPGTECLAAMTGGA